jgi:2'-5' RNA ligase
MRLFVALPVPRAAQQAIGELIKDVAVPDSPVRWVREEGLHLTLKFFGEVDEAGVPPITTALARTVAGMSPLAVTANELNGFPALERARVVWIGLETPPALELLAHRVQQECEALGFPGEARVFHPHITLGRVKDGARLDRTLLQRLSAVRPSIPFVIESMVLFHSRLGPGGAVHTPLASFALSN